MDRSVFYVNRNGKQATVYKFVRQEPFLWWKRNIICYVVKGDFDAVEITGKRTKKDYVDKQGNLHIEILKED